MWIVAKFSPSEWRKPFLCDNCLVKKRECKCQTDYYLSTEHKYLMTNITSRYSNISSQNVFKQEEETETACLQIYESGNHLDFKENDFNVLNSFWFALGSLMQQGSDLNPEVQNRKYNFNIIFQTWIRKYYTPSLRPL